MFPVKDNIPSDRVPVITLVLILLNVVAYLLAVVHGGSFFGGPDTAQAFKYGLIPHAFTHSGHHPPGTRIATWETVFSAMFMHASLIHLVGNMLFLWIFGGSVEARLGRVTFVLVYLLAGAASFALMVGLEPDATAPTLGAAGAIAGVLGVYVVTYPHGKVLAVVLAPLLSTVVELPLWAMLLLWLGMQSAFAATHLTTPQGATVAGSYVWYLAGLACGVLAGALARSRAGEPVPAP